MEMTNKYKIILNNWDERKVAEDALEFYADKKSWIRLDDRVAILEDDTELSDYVNQLGADEYCGKRAREALAELRKRKE